MLNNLIGKKVHFYALALMLTLIFCGNVLAQSCPSGEWVVSDCSQVSKDQCNGQFHVSTGPQVTWVGCWNCNEACYAPLGNCGPGPGCNNCAIPTGQDTGSLCYWGPNFWAPRLYGCYASIGCPGS
jgi:hypothetical protein